MRILLWIFLGLLGNSLLTALGSRWVFAHVFPDFTVLVIVFLAMRYEPLIFAPVAFVLGYFVDRQAISPIGLHSTALLFTALCVYFIVGQLVSSGIAFFAFVAALTVMGYHLILFLLAYLVMGTAHFSSLATALLVPSALVTFCTALLFYPLMQKLDGKVVQKKRHEGLSWR